MEDPRLETHRAIAGQHPEVEPENRHVEIGPDIRDHPLRDAADQHGLRVECSPFGKRQQQHRNRNRDQDEAFARLECVDQVVDQQRIPGGRTGDHDDQQVRDDEGASVFRTPALDQATDGMPRGRGHGRRAGHHVNSTSAVARVAVRSLDAQRPAKG